MMGGVGQPAGHHPGARPPHIEERRLAFPPRLLLVPQYKEALSAIFRVAPHKFKPDFFSRQRRRSDIYVEHRSKPGIFTDTLMHHMLMQTSAARIGCMRAYR